MLHTLASVDYSAQSPQQSLGNLPMGDDMEYLIVLCIGVGLSSAFWIAAIRRAAKKPDGKTARAIKLLTP